MHKMFQKNMDCCGCRACEDVCEQKAIHMEADPQGFWYPVIDDNRCVDCGLCQEVCQIGKWDSVSTNTVKQCYGVKNKEEIRAVSSSGGVYTAISDYVLRQGGLCVGACYDETMRVVHAVATNSEERDRFRGSKYVQSDTTGVYKLIRGFLTEGKYVLFTGTPCQCAALKLYLQKKKTETKNLFLMDVVCHGVPSPRVWAEHVHALEKTMGAKMTDYTFRNKEVGWRNYNVKAWFANGKTCSGTPKVKAFARLFSMDVMLRPSCYYCPYAAMERCADVTIGDFWGIEQLDQAYSDNQGISMLLINTQKGVALWEACSGDVASAKKYDPNKLTQPQLFGPTNFSREYDAFWKEYTKRGYAGVAVKFGSGNKTTARFYDFVRKVKNRLARV